MAHLLVLYAVLSTRSGWVTKSVCSGKALVTGYHWVEYVVKAYVAPDCTRVIQVLRGIRADHDWGHCFVVRLYTVGPQIITLNYDYYTILNWFYE
jgi:hypothetical protein